MLHSKYWTTAVTPNVAPYPVAVKYSQALLTHRRSWAKVRAVKTIGSIALNEYSQTANYFLEYPEDIKLYGVSFNTQLSGIGMALQGEYSYRDDVPTPGR